MLRAHEQKGMEMNQMIDFGRKRVVTMRVFRISGMRVGVETMERAAGAAEEVANGSDVRGESWPLFPKIATVITKYLKVVVGPVLLCKPYQVRARTLKSEKSQACFDHLDKRQDASR